MATIHLLPHDCLLHTFSYVTVKDICAVSRTCKLWYRLAREETISVQRERLEHITYHNLRNFDQLPRIRIDLQLKCFTIFQDKMIGETLTGHLCIYHPYTGTTCVLDYQPPYSNGTPGEFLASSEDCVFCLSRSRFYQIDAKTGSCKRINFKSQFIERALLKKKIYCWESTRIKYSFEELIREKKQFYFTLRMEIFNLEDQSVTELSYPTSKIPRLYLSEDKWILHVSRWIHVLDENLSPIGDSTFWQCQASNIHSTGKKIFIEGASFNCQGNHHWTQRYIAIKEIGDRNNFGEEIVNLPENSSGKLHPFFIEGGWKFLQCEGLKHHRTIWYLEQGYLTCINLARRIV